MQTIIDEMEISLANAWLEAYAHNSEAAKRHLDHVGRLLDTAYGMAAEYDGQGHDVDDFVIQLDTIEGAAVSILGG